VYWPSFVHVTVGLRAVALLKAQVPPWEGALCTVQSCVSAYPSTLFADPLWVIADPSLPEYGPPAPTVKIATQAVAPDVNDVVPIGHGVSTALPVCGTKWPGVVLDMDSPHSLRGSWGSRRLRQIERLRRTRATD
jgi:hypothetical protein